MKTIKWHLSASRIRKWGKSNRGVPTVKVHLFVRFSERRETIIDKKLHLKMQLAAISKYSSRLFVDCEQTRKKLEGFHNEYTLSDCATQSKNMSSETKVHRHKVLHA